MNDMSIVQKLAQCPGEVVVTYTIYDDGIHLDCLGCRWHRHVGFSPNVKELLDKARHEPKESEQ